jgi:hypothetical protein
MSKKIIFLSGPPRVGKDTTGEYIRQIAGITTLLEKFSAPMKAAIPAMLQMPFEVLEAQKEKPLDDLGLPSFRHLQQDMSEKWMKPLYGEDVFARFLAARIRQATENLIVVTDCGFQVEVDYLTKTFGAANILLLNLSRDGCSYAGDTRRPVHATEGMQSVCLRNPWHFNVSLDELMEFRRQVRYYVKLFLGQLATLKLDKYDG